MTCDRISGKDVGVVAFGVPTSKSPYNIFDMHVTLIVLVPSNR